MSTELIKKLEKFTGKRNAVITLIVAPETDFPKYMDKIYRQVKAIKHSNKRYQILRALNWLKGENSDIKKFGGNGAILCSGYNIYNVTTYCRLNPPYEIQENEYYYGYKFNIQRIREIFYQEIIKKLDETEEKNILTEVANHINNSTNLIVIGDELEYALEMKVVDVIYYMLDIPISYELIEKVKGSKAVIIKIDIDRADNKDMAKKYGSLLGKLKYPLAISEWM